MTIDLADHLDALRIAVGKFDALITVAVESYDNTSWRSADSLQIDRMAHLLGAAADAATTAIEAVDRFRTLVADRQPAATGYDWGDQR